MLPSRTHDAAQRLRALVEEELAGLQSHRANAVYLAAHSLSTGGLERQIRSVERYAPYVQGRVLDWGCKHAPDSCILRLLGRSELELYGCDIDPPAKFPVMHRFAGLHYERLSHYAHLPYPDEHFDTVISDGVLEHVPNDSLSLQEVYRVLKPRGCFIVCCLPNRLSYTELLSRCLGLPHHLRTYGMREARSMLLHHGLCPVTWRYEQMVPTLSGAGATWKGAWLRRTSSLLWNVNPPLERLWPLNRLATNLFLVARKSPFLVATGRIKARRAA